MLTLLTRASIGSRERSVWTPAEFQSCKQNARGHVQFGGPVRQALRFIAERHQVISATIPRLLSLRGPSAVVRGVVAVVVNAVNGIAARLWARPHVGNEMVVRLKPAVADGDAPAAVMFERSIVRIGAALFHGPPNVELSRDVAVPCVAMFQVDACGGFSLKTPARLAAALFQHAQCNRFNDAADASANLPAIFAGCLRFVGVDNHPTMKNGSDWRIWQSFHVSAVSYCVSFK